MRLTSLIAILVGVLPFIGVARAADSVVLGRAVSNTYNPDVNTCPGPDVCTDPFFVWEISVSRTISGPPVSGRVQASRLQHAGFVRAYMRRKRVFLLRPIDDLAQRTLLHADYVLVDMSEDLCLFSEPRDIPTADIHVVRTDRGDSYCFGFSRK
jgi:hypothetical protein